MLPSHAWDRGPTDYEQGIPRFKAREAEETVSPDRRRESAGRHARAREDCLTRRAIPRLLTPGS